MICASKFSFTNQIIYLQRQKLIAPISNQNSICGKFMVDANLFTHIPPTNNKILAKIKRKNYTFCGSVNLNHNFAPLGILPAVLVVGRASPFGGDHAWPDRLRGGAGGTEQRAFSGNLGSR